MAQPRSEIHVKKLHNAVGEQFADENREKWHGYQMTSCAKHAAIARPHWKSSAGLQAGLTLPEELGPCTSKGTELGPARVLGFEACSNLLLGSFHQNRK